MAKIEDVICGCALPGGEQGHNLGRIISILAGIGAPGTTVNRYCASSLKVVRMAFHAIEAGEGSAFLCAGVLESSTRSPLGKFADQPETQNPRLLPGNREGLPAAFMSMGETAKNVADKYDVTREEMDRYALQSHIRAVEARNDGIFAKEIIGVPLSDGHHMTAMTAPGRTPAGAAGHPEAGVPGGRPGDSRQVPPAQRRSGRRHGDVGDTGRSWGSRRSPASSLPGSAPWSRS